MRPTFDAALIADLKARVVAHNETHPQKVKLAELRKAYEQGFRGRSNPGHRAMAKVETYLTGLAKADNFDESEHPRAHGEFTTKAGTHDLPASLAEHKAAQAGNAGYRAITTDVIPERRYEAGGAVARDTVALTAGTAAIAALARNKPGSAGERAAGHVVGAVSGLAAGAGGAIVDGALHTAGKGVAAVAQRVKPGATGGNRVTRAVRGVAGKTVDRVAQGLKASNVREVAGESGRKAGNAIGRYGVRGAGSLVQSTLTAAGNGPMRAAAKARHAKVLARSLKGGASAESALARATKSAMRLDGHLKFGRKAAVFGALAGFAGLAIRSQIKDTVFDPASIGRSIDAFSFRSVQKAVAASNELGDARRAVSEVLAKDAAGGSVESLQRWLEAGGGDDLQKISFGQFGRSAVHLFSGAAGVAGAAIAGGATHLATRPASGDGHKGNPYRDSHGKFSSKANAVTGGAALLGGLGAGLAVYAALRSHNTKVFTRSVQGLERSVQNTFHSIMDGSHPVLKALTEPGARVARIKEIADKSAALKPLRDEMQALADHGASAVPALKGKLQDIYHDRIANMLTAFPETVLPTKNGPMSISQIASANPRFAPRASTATSVRQSMMAAEVKKVLDDGLTGKQLEDATKDIPEQTRALILDHFGKKQGALANIESDIEAHGKKIDAAKDKVDHLTAALHVVRDQHSVASAAMHVVAPGTETDAAKVALESASKARDAADAAVVTATEAHAKLKANPKGVEHPFTFAPLRPPTREELVAKQAEIAKQIETKAVTLFDNQVETTRKKLVLALAPRRARLMAAMATAGARDNVGARGKKVLSVLDQASKEHAAATRKLAIATDHADLQTAQAGGKGITKPRAKDVLARRDEIEAGYKQSPGQVGPLSQAVTASRAKLEAATKQVTLGPSLRLLAGVRKKMDDAGRSLADARVAHVPIEADFKDLEALRAGRTLAPGRATDIQGRIPEIENAHANSVKAMAATEAEMHEHATKLLQATSIMTEAMKQQPQRGLKPGEFLPHRLKRDLRRAQDAIAGPARGFLAKPTGKKLADYAGWLKDGAVTHGKKAWANTKDSVWNGVQAAVTDAGADGKRTWSPGKTLALGTLVGGAVETLRGDTGKLYYSVFGDPETKAAARAAPFSTRTEKLKDPLTGAGFTGISIPDKKRPGERVLLWGEKRDSENGRPVPLPVGANVKELHQRVRQDIERQNQAKQQQHQQRMNGGQPGGGGNNPDLHLGDAGAAVNAAHGRLSGKNKLVAINSQGAPSLRVRDQQEPDGKEEAGKVMSHIRSLSGEGSLTGDAYHKALGAVFSRQGEVLQARQAYRHLTGYHEHGQEDQATKPILKANAAYGSKSAASPDVAKALSDEIDRSLPSATTPLQRANLQRAVDVVGNVKKLSADQLAPLHARLRGAAPAPAAAAPTHTPSPARPEPTRALTVPEKEPIDVSQPTPAYGPIAPRDRIKEDQDARHTHAAHYAEKIARKLDITSPDSVDGLTGFLHATAVQVQKNHDLGPEDAVIASHDALVSAIQRGDETADGIHEALASNGVVGGPKFASLLRQASLARAKKVSLERAILLDDVDALMKVSFGDFVESLHPRAPSGPDGGEFVAAAAGAGAGAGAGAAAGAHGGGGLGSRVANETAEAGTKKLGGTAGDAVEAGQAWNHPVRLGSEVGSALGYETAFKIAQRFLPGGIGKIASFVAEGASGLAGSEVGSTAGEAVGNQVLLGRGQKAVDYTPPQVTSLKETGAGLAGSIAGPMAGQAAGSAIGAWAGGAVGSALGGPVGAVGGVFAGRALGGFAGGIAGAYAGDLGARGIYRYFAGMDQPAAQKALARFGGKTRGTTAA